MARLKVGVIGAGHMGRNHARNFRELASVDLVGVADISSEAKVVAEENETRLYEDYLQMIEKEGIDAVSIAVPTTNHFKVASEMLNLGIHTLVEKPIAETMEQAKELGKLAAGNEVVFTVGHIERYNPLVRTIGEIVTSGEIGKVTSIVTTRIGGLPIVEPQTDVISDLAIHDIDVIQYLVRQPIKLISSHGSRTFHSSEIDSAEIMLGTNGTAGFLQANWITPTKIREIRVTGGGGFLRGNYITQELEFLKTNLTDEAMDFSTFVQRLGQPDIVRQEILKQEPLKVELNHFINAIISGDTSALVSANEASNALDIALQAKSEAIRRIGNG